ncbi:MAG: DUF1553 domain-containing protein [Rubripirellula sp.]
MSAFIAAHFLAVTTSFGGPPDALPGGDSKAEQIEFFEARIRPVLVEHCYRCHNAADEQQGDLAVDDREGMLRGGTTGPIVVPGDPAASRLIAILKHEVEGLEMPEDGPKLDARVIEDFESWIKSGAVDPRDAPPSASELAETTSWPKIRQRRMQWWSWQPIQKVSPPPGEGEAIDRFILSRLTESGLTPSPPADQETLIRRLYLTLIGLPPTTGERERWLRQFNETKDQREAIDDLIQHLLDSEHFGERWARHWMDWIRYAESHGSEGDPAIDNAWTYRDYLIRAFNNDIPYDTLVREHIAGDLLQEPRINESLGINESMIGPAHWRMVFHGFAPTDALDEKVRFIDDQIDVFSKAFLGLTVSCARCHDHKFDAISQKDYYALFGILGSCRPGRRVIDLPAIQNHNAETMRLLKPKIRQALVDDWLETEPEIRNRIRQIGGEDSSQKGELSKSIRQLCSGTNAEQMKEVWNQWNLQRDARAASPPGGAVHQRWNFEPGEGDDGWYREELGLQSGSSPPGDFAVSLEGERAITSVYPAGTYSHLLTPKHAARLTSPDFRIAENQAIWVHAIGDRDATSRYAIQDYPRNGTVYPVKPLKPEWTWHRFDVGYWAGDSAHIELVAGKDAPLLTKNADRSWFGIREVRITDRSSSAPPPDSRYLDALLECSEGPPTSTQDSQNLIWRAIARALQSWIDDSCSDAEADLIEQALREGLLRNTVSELPRVAPLITEYRTLEQSIVTPTRVPGLDETVGRVQPLYVRGNHKQPDETVPRRFLEAIDETPYGSAQSGRLQLADDLLRKDNPLTRRVIVNRVWHHLFGRGIVETPDNLGRLGRTPTHPELLDWLALQLEHDGWSLKTLIRRIVRTKTWQQSSMPSAAASEIDPDNGLLSHANVRRNDAEAIRDSLLVASGTLDRKQFGPPVNGASRRRSVYVGVIRNRLDPFLRVFDFPEPSSTTGRRDVTNVPAQSLTMMNDVRVLDHASKLAEQILQAKQSSSDEERIARLFLSLFSRDPTPSETEFAKGFLTQNQIEVDATMARVADLRRKIESLEKNRDEILEPARESLLAARPNQDTTESLRPFASWSFESDLKDAVGDLHGIKNGGASVQDGALVLKKGGFVTTPPIPRTIQEKTLEAWVSVADLGQRGGGVVTIQSPNGSTFDSIVFGERDPQQWLAGSNNFQRTEPFGGAAEDSSPDRFVHIAIVYDSDGRITGYRDGKRYGESYRRDSAVPYRAGEAIISFGVRHLPAGGNRLFTGRIDRANLYDRALSAEEVAASFSRHGAWISDDEVINSLSQSKRAKLRKLSSDADQLTERLNQMGPIPDRYGDQEAWTDLTRTLLTLKEFIYVR